jgi:hypothetical protein
MSKSVFRERNIIHSQFLPFGAGLALISEKSDQVYFFQVVERPKSFSLSLIQRKPASNIQQKQQ